MPKDDQLYNSHLVQAVRKHPCLYNCNLREYSNKRMTNDAWESIAKEMNDSVVNCKEKWRNLRIVFSRHFQKSLYGNDAGKNKYYLYEQMEFLKPFVRCRISQTFLPYADTNEETSDNLEIDESVPVKKEDCETRCLCDEQLDRRRLGMEPLRNKTKHDHDEYETQTEYRVDYYVEHPKKRTKFSYDADHSDTELSRPEHVNTRNCRLQFLQSLLPDVEEMTPPQFRKFRKKVADTIDEILDLPTPNCNANLN